MGLDRVDAKNIATAATQTISGSDFTLEHQNRSVLLVTIAGMYSTYASDASTAIADGVKIGQLLTIVLVNRGTYNGITIKDNANTKLQGDWNRTSVETWLKLVWDGNDWIQIAANDGIGNDASGAVAHAEGLSTTASGDYAHAEGFGTAASTNFAHAEGENTSAAGTASHAEGSDTTASGFYSHAGGLASVAALWCESAQGSGRFVHFGDAQFSRVVMWKNTTNATLTELLLNDYSARLTILDEYTYACKVMVVGRQQSSQGNDHFMGTYHVMIERTGGTVALVGAVDIIYENNAGGVGAGGGLPVVITADNTNKSLCIKVEGLAVPANHNIRWVATVEMVRVNYS